MASFTLASDPKVNPRAMKPVPSGRQVDEVFHGDATTEPSASLLGGYCTFDPINASMLLGLLPRMLHIRGTDPAIGSVAPIVELIKREALERRAGQVLVLTRLIEVMLVEALRSAPPGLTRTGLLAGLRSATRGRLARDPYPNGSSLDACHTRARSRHVAVFLRGAICARDRNHAAQLSAPVAARRRQEHVDPRADDGRRDGARGRLRVSQRVQHSVQPRNRPLPKRVHRGATKRRVSRVGAGFPGAVVAAGLVFPRLCLTGPGDLRRFQGNLSIRQPGWATGRPCVDARNGTARGRVVGCLYRPWLHAPTAP